MDEINDVICFWNYIIRGKNDSPDCAMTQDKKCRWSFFLFVSHEHFIIFPSKNTRCPIVIWMKMQSTMNYDVLSATSHFNLQSIVSIDGIDNKHRVLSVEKRVTYLFQWLLEFFSINSIVFYSSMFSMSTNEHPTSWFCWSSVDELSQTESDLSKWMFMERISRWSGRTFDQLSEESTRFLSMHVIHCSPKERKFVRSCSD